VRPDIDRPGRGRLHRTDWMALLSGMLFIAAGIIFINQPTVDSLVMLPIILCGLGFAGLVAILARVIRR
jgi:uncharacterized membrane protein HdeD (DUF308 family)